ncbi:MAG: type I DNA topoisomerase [Aquificaceae bacterium]|nr:type I DNA topoisomerase [Aquificaceae bacterium]
MKLFIVESPIKAKTIAKYLGKDWIVKATLGHIKDLPPDSLGVDEETLKPTFTWVKGKKKIMDDIKRVAQRADHIFIGTDPDREGEAIAYFVYKELEKLKKPINRVVFYEITKESIKDAVENPTEINQNLVKAQFARRILDRLICYKLSPHLWKAFKKNTLSIGRVQSPALRLIVEREREILSFRKKEYYYIKVIFEKDGVEFSALWDYRFEKPENAKPYLEKIKDALFEVAGYEEEKEKRQPPAPFITSSLQATANSLLKLSVEQTQRIAQKLYEEGHITYPRTDSHRMNPKKAQEFMKFIEKTYGKEYVGALRKFKEKETAQGAHECIRPTSLQKPPLQGKEKELYELIFKRTLASLMAPAILIKKKAILTPLYEKKKGEEMYFVAKGSELFFDGYLKVYPESLELLALPRLKKGEILKPKKITLEKRQTQPPPRYTEGSLVKKLEELGIGRPSTYAVIVKTLKERGYVVEEKGYLKPTDLAFEVVDFIKEWFPKVVDYKFTSQMEEGLDRVEEGKEDWKEMVRKFFSSLNTSNG